jgi:hypothetical protein
MLETDTTEQYWWPRSGTRSPVDVYLVLRLGKRSSRIYLNWLLSDAGYECGIGGDLGKRAEAVKDGTRLPRRRRGDGPPHARARLGGDAAWSAGAMAAEPQNRRPDNVNIAPADLDRLGARPDLSLQRSLQVYGRSASQHRLSGRRFGTTSVPCWPPQ